MRFVTWLVLGGCSATTGGNPELVGDVAPALVLADGAGVFHDLSEAEGVVVVDFAAMWCLRCNESATELQALYDERAADGVDVWTVLFQDNDGDDPDATDLRAWAEVHVLAHPVLADEGERTFDAWGAGHQPVIFVVDPDGRIVWTGDGPDHRDAIDEAIDGAL